MKRIYNKLINILYSIVRKTELVKTWTAEWFAIFRKKTLYKDVKWTKEQQKEFDEFWKTNYGKKISNRWHKLYEACSREHRIDYLPEILYTTKIEPKFNNYEYCKVYADKNLNEIFFNGRIDGVRTPKTFLSNSHGRFYDGDRHLISREKAIEIFANVGMAVIKPAVDSSSGKNVVIVEMKEGKNIRNGASAEDIINSYKVNFIVQEKIVPNKELETLYPKAINTVRAISYIVGDRIEIAPLSLRIGGGGSEVDNIHAGGMSVAVSDEGSLHKFAYRLGYGDSIEKYASHPDTGIVFEGYKLSFMSKIVKVAKNLHELTSNIGVVSWDFTVDKEDNVVIIEANFRGQSVWFPQMLSGNAFFGNDTAEILSCAK